VDIEIRSRRGYLHIGVAKREGVADASDALQRIIEAIEADGHDRVLVSVRQSQAIFGYAEYGLLDAITRLAGIPGLKIALVADSDELLVSYRYIEALAHERSLVARAFRSHRQACRWLVG
jgi:hypothetical protein